MNFITGISVFLLSWQIWAKSDPLLRIKVSSYHKKITLSGADLYKKSFFGKKTKVAKRRLSFNCDETRYLKSTKKEAIWAEVSSLAGIIRWKNHYLTGKLFLVRNDQKKGYCYLVSELTMEDYLSQVLSKEMHPSWPMEALKAQAVVARTYAYFKMNKNRKRQNKNQGRAFDLKNSELDQVMGSVIDRSSKTTKASLETRGEILISSQGKIQEAFYHSKCGGQTLTPKQVWGGGHIHDYKNVKCPFCHKHGKKNWSRTYPKDYLNGLLVSAGYLENKTIENKNYMTMVIDSQKKSFKKTSLRKVLGRSRLPSHNYDFLEKKKTVTVLGKGHGHGVGLCQYGAYEMAKRGLNYKQILNFYFPLMRMKKIY